MVRNLERRLERLVEGLAGKVFRGPLHPVELGSRLVREADLALRTTAVGPVAPNAYVIHVNPSDLGDGRLPDGLSAELAAYLEEMAIERGWRLEGPTVVHVELDTATSSGSIRCKTDFNPGPLPVWAFLAGTSDEFPLRHNRLAIGRASDCEVIVDHPQVSRTHAFLWREAGSVWLVDANSSNGTSVDGVPIEAATAVEQGSVVGVGPVAFTFRGA